MVSTFVFYVILIYLIIDRENKNLKLDHVKKYLLSQKMILGADNQKGKLLVDGFKEMKGECSIAVVRGKPRIGHSLTMTV